MTVPTEWRWGCLRCLTTGAADSEANALALLGMHEMFACPATAAGDERKRRLAWRRTLAERYGTESYGP